VQEKKFTSTWGVNSNPLEIIGTGPFYLKEYVPSQKLVLEKNPYYWRKDKDGKQLPYLDQLIILIVPDQDADLLKFQSGEIDILSPRGQDFSLLKVKEKEGKMEIKGVALDNPTIAQFMTNLEKSGVVKNVELVVSQQVEKKILKLKEFTLTCQVQYGSSPSGPTS
jgi:peptide/nickel transport system substrate-binding protein